MSFLLHPLSHGRLRFGFSYVLLAGAFLVSWKPAQAATFTVTSTADSGVGSLREAIGKANSAEGADTITFDLPSGPQTITLETAGDDVGGDLSGLSISDPVTIQGPGANLLTVQRATPNTPAFRLLRITANTNVTISGIAFSHGTTSISRNHDGSTRGYNGGSINNAGTLILANCWLHDNTAVMSGTSYYSFPSGGQGGAVFNTGTLTMRGCTLSANYATSSFLWSGSGLCNNGQAKVTNCTFSGNKGAIGTSVVNSGHITLESSTFSGNTIFVSNSATVFNLGTLSIKNCVLNDVTNGGNRENIVSINASKAKVTDGGYNVGCGSTKLLSNPTDKLNTDARLGSLTDNGGPTPTIALLPGSPAIDAGETSLKTDQRGFRRSIGQGDDVGAFELQEVPFGIQSLTLLPSGPKTKTILIARVVVNKVTTKTSYTYVWKKNGEVIRTSTGSKSNQSRLDLNVADNGDKGDVISVEVTVNDGTVANLSSTQTVSVTVLNSIPVLNEVKLNLLTPTATQTVKATLQGGDADSTDTLVPLCKWRLNGTVLMAEKGTWVALSKYPNIKAGDVLSLEARLTDGTAFSKTVRAQATVAGSTAPVSANTVSSPAPVAPSAQSF